MHGLQTIKAMNATQNSQAVAERYQAQWKGDGWRIYDSHTNGWGDSTYARAFDAQQAADALNT